MLQIDKRLFGAFFEAVRSSPKPKVMVPHDNPKERSGHKRSSDPLHDQKPGIGKQPYRGNDIDERSSLGDDATSTYENREDEGKP